ncbi:hypothetical protein BJY52DRAFT_1413987 [Lactarius psammicola]|nr:hypothetical protein BJY52DRAFT_1413987 [Lactarius psammicola]
MAKKRKEKKEKDSLVARVLRIQILQAPEALAVREFGTCSSRVTQETSPWFLVAMSLLDYTAREAGYLPGQSPPLLNQTRVFGAVGWTPRERHPSPQSPVAWHHRILAQRTRLHHLTSHGDSLIRSSSWVQGLLEPSFPLIFRGYAFGLTIGLEHYCRAGTRRWNDEVKKICSTVMSVQSCRSPTMILSAKVRRRCFCFAMHATNSELNKCFGKCGSRRSPTLRDCATVASRASSTPDEILADRAKTSPRLTHCASPTVLVVAPLRCHSLGEWRMGTRRSSIAPSLPHRKYVCQSSSDLLVQSRLAPTSTAYLIGSLTNPYAGFKSLQESSWWRCACFGTLGGAKNIPDIDTR